MATTNAFRSRRPPSPPAGATFVHNHTLDGDFPSPLPNQPIPAPRFPHPKSSHLDADIRLEQAKLSSLRVLPASSTRTGDRVGAFGGINLSSGEWKLLALVTIVAAFVRTYKISHPDSVVFDEVHFGKFASKYIKTQYFVDVHPPLAKLLITLVSFLFLYDGQFDFKEIGKMYENTPYVAMRLLSALLGVGLVPIGYLTLRALSCRPSTALLGSLFILFENGLITQSRLILLDSPLVFFTGLSTLFWVAFTNENRRRAFSERWWLSLTLSGLALGAVASCKWVGLFTIALVGLSTIRQLWVLLGDLRVPPRMLAKHFFARALCLIVIPILFYMAMFEIHFLILENSGEGDGFMSSEFQHTLGGRGMADTFADVALGSTVTIRHWNTQGGYLHSHPHNFPTGSKQQQITLYPHRDSNNDWIITNVTREGEKDFDFANNPLIHVLPGMELRLEHAATGKRLHSHGEYRPPISEQDFQNEVSGYGFEGFKGDANDYWILEIFKGDDRDKESGKRVRTLRTKFRLRHALTGCYLFSHKVKLPEWGWEQQEVTCNKNAPKDNSLWFVETNTHPMLPANAEKVNYRLPGFLSKFLELQQVMWTTNAGLTDRHTFDSRPSHWPRLRRGINFWVKDHQQIYLIGNPWVWWLSTLSIVAYVGVRGFLIVRAKRGYKDFNNSNRVRYDELCAFLFLGWGLHYFPFFLMARQLFLHHYFPALYFAVLLFCAVFDILTASLHSKYRLQIVGVVAIIAIVNWAYFMPLAYGTPWTKGQCKRAQWLRTWDFSCSDFLENSSMYASTSSTSVAPPVVTIGGEDQGRAAVVVNAPPAAHGGHGLGQGKGEGEGQLVEEKPTTAPAPNVPAPGPDVFENPEGMGAQSRSVVMEEQQEQHVVTNVPGVGGGGDKVIEKVAVPPPEGSEKESAGEKAKHEEHGLKRDDSEQHQTITAAPKDDAAAERDRVGQELFGEKQK